MMYLNPESFFDHSKGVNPDEKQLYSVFIWVFTFYKSTRLGVSVIQRRDKTKHRTITVSHNGSNKQQRINNRTTTLERTIT